MRESSRDEILFATSNPHKVREAEAVLSGYGLRVRTVDGKGTEIQSDDLQEIASYASRQASSRLGAAVLVEDSGLFVDSLGGFPGPYSSYVFRTVGLPTFLRLMEGQGSRGAVFRSAVAYCEPNRAPVSLEGRLEGTITSSVAGVNGFGFDPVFRPEGAEKTLAEMSVEEKCAISHRGESMRKFASWYRERVG